MPEPVPFIYRAFLSYSHRDKAWAAWLHRALEHTRIDKDLVGRDTPAGPVPATLRPVFRDRDDFAAGHSLTDQTIAALEGSQFVVAICSPNAARSQYVNEEIRRFKAMGRGDRIIPLIVDGEPGDPERECFPPALRFKLNPDGTVGTEREEPIAADAREHADGKRAALIKITAALLSVRLDEVIRRADRARARQRRFRGAIAGAFLVLVAGGSAALAWGYRKSLESDAWMDEVVRVSAGFVSEATDMSERLGIPVDVPLALLTRADAALNGYIAKGKDSPKLRHRRALTLLSLAANYAKLGRSAQQLERAQEARELLEALVAEDGRDQMRRHDLANAYTAVADVMLAHGGTEEALAQYRKSLAIREALIKEYPDSAQAQRELTVTYERIGDLQLEQGDLEGATRNYTALLTLRERLASASSDLDAQHDLSIAYARLGEVAAHRGALREAVRQHQAALAISKRLVEAKPANATYIRDLAVAHNTLARVLLSLTEVDNALAEFKASLALRLRLAAVDPTNAIWQRDLAVSHENIGNIHAVLGAFPAALEAYRAAYAIHERLSAADPKSAEARRDLSIARGKIASTLASLGKTDEALALLRENIAVREKLVAANPKNTQWQLDLSATHEAMAGILAERGATAEALAHFERRLAILAPLATANGDAALRRQLGYTHFKLGGLHSAQNAPQRAIESYRESLAIRVPLAAENPAVTALQMEVVFVRWALADLGDDAVTQMEEVVGTLRRLKSEGLLGERQAALLPDAEARLARLKP